MAAAVVLTALAATAAADECLKLDFTDATFAATRENTVNPTEAVAFAFDGDIHTKWLDYAGGQPSQATVTLPAAAAVATYGIVSGNDVPGRDPAVWTLSGSVDGAQWVMLDTQSGIAFTARQQRRAFTVNYAGAAYSMYRLDVSAVAGGNATDLMQLAELELWEGAACHDACCGVDCGDHGECNSLTGMCSCDAFYSGDSCEVADTQWNEFSGRVLTNDDLVWYKTTTVAECQKRCDMDWTGTATPCIGVSYRLSDGYCFVKGDGSSYGATLEASSDYTSYLPYWN